MTDPDRRRVRMRATSRGHGQTYQAGNDQNFSGVHNHRHDYDLDITGITGLLTGRGPGRVIGAAGLLLVMFCFAGWVSIVYGLFQAMQDDSITSVDNIFGDDLPSGVPIGIAYLLGAGLGAILVQVGSSMAKAGERRHSLIGHYFLTLILIGAGIISYSKTVGTAPLSAITPRFDRAATSAAPDAKAATQAVATVPRSASSGGLVMTVVRIDNRGDRGVVQIRMVNRTGETLGVLPSNFLLTDSAGRTYHPRALSNDWNNNMGPGATQAGDITLSKAVALGHGPLRAEFTRIFSLHVRSIAVQGIPSR